MIAVNHYRVTGNEDKTLTETILYNHASSGYEMIDVIVNGYSKNFSIVTVDNTYGKVTVPELLERNDHVVFICKTLPRFATDREFSPINFDSSEFA